MTELNRVILRGTIGAAKAQNISGTTFVRATIATNFAYKDKNNALVIETTWTNLTIWESEHCQNLDKISKRTPVEVEGRLRSNRYTDTNGNERTATEVLVKRLTILETAPVPERL